MQRGIAVARCESCASAGHSDRRILRVTNACHTPGDVLRQRAQRSSSGQRRVPALCTRRGLLCGARRAPSNQTPFHRAYSRVMRGDAHCAETRALRRRFDDVLRRFMRDVAAPLLGCAPDELASDEPLMESGMDSLAIVSFRNEQLSSALVVSPGPRSGAGSWHAGKVQTRRTVPRGSRLAHESTARSASEGGRSEGEERSP